MLWLLESEVRKRIEQAQVAGFEMTEAQRMEFLARFDDHDGRRSSRILSIAGNVAEIQVVGVLTVAPDWGAMFFGGGNTLYSEIISALSDAQNDPNVDSIVMAFDSPGGSVAGVLETVEAIQRTTKPIKGVVSNFATSAAYLLVSQVGSISALNRMSTLGSVGVVASVFVDEDVVDITSKAAPDKAPDVTTVEGRETVQTYLDGLHEIMVGAIASGRGTTVENVNTNYGHGGLVLADAALAKGMIDSISGVSTTVISGSQTTTAQSGGESMEASDMTLEELRAQHPALFAEAVNKGVMQERDRVTAHAEMGKSFGAMELALNAIADGSDMTQTLQAKYQTAGRNAADIAAADADDAAASVADGTGKPISDPGDQADAVADLMEQGMALEALTNG